MSGPSQNEFLTPRAVSLALREAEHPQWEETVPRGEPLMVTRRLPGGFVEVDYAGRLWFATESSLEPWRSASPGLAAPSGMPTPPDRSAWGRAGQPFAAGSS